MSLGLIVLIVWPVFSRNVREFLGLCVTLWGSSSPAAEPGSDYSPPPCWLSVICPVHCLSGEGSGRDWSFSLCASGLFMDTAKCYHNNTTASTFRNLWNVFRLHKRSRNYIKENNSCKILSVMTKVLSKD